MNRSMILGIVIALVVVAGGAAYLYHSNKEKNEYKEEPTTSSSNSTSNSNSSSTTPSNTNSVTIQNFAFSPASITVKKGTTVTWTNQDGAAHTVTESDSQTGPSSGDLETGKTYSFTFNTAGTFHYHCSIHPSMTGTVTVTE